MAPDDPANQTKHDPNPRRTEAWLRFRKLMGWMALAALAAGLLALLYLSLMGPLTLHMAIATLAGVIVSVLLGTALMGLVYFSDRSGHDADAHHTKEKDRNKGEGQ